MGDVTKNKESHVGERSASPPEINSYLFPPNNALDQVLKSREYVQKDTFFSKFAEIDEGLSKIKAGPIIVNDSLIAKIPINEHVTSEEVKEVARVSQVLEEVNYAASHAATSETQTIQAPWQQGSWKKLNKADLSSKPVRNSSTIKSVLSTKRVFEELSHPNGLPSKKRAVSVEINSSKLAEANAQSRPTQ